MLVLAN